MSTLGRPLRNRPAANRTLGLVAAVFALLSTLGTACNRPPDGVCRPECAPTFACDAETERCRPKTADGLDLDPPGRGLDAATDADQTFLAAIHPGSGYVFAGDAEEMQALAALDRIDAAGNARTAIAATSRGRVAVVWRDGSGTFRIARRRDGRWTPADSIELDEDYQSTSDFDIALARDGTAHLLFRSSDPMALRRLRSNSDGSWSLETVDDGSTLPSRSSCPPGGADPRRAGVGHDPDADIFRTGTGRELSVSYYDGNCGDLRLAQTSGAEWDVRLVATGAYSTPNSTGRRPGNAGRHSSLAVGSDRQLAVAYKDLRRARLAFAAEEETTFRSALVDPGLALGTISERRKQVVGAFADLAIDDGGRPYIAYMNGSTTHLRLAYRAETRGGERRWFHRRISDPPLTGFRAQIVLGERRVRVFSERLVRQDGRYRSRLTVTSIPKP